MRSTRTLAKAGATIDQAYMRHVCKRCDGQIAVEENATEGLTQFIGSMPPDSRPLVDTVSSHTELLSGRQESKKLELYRIWIGRSCPEGVQKYR
jgi:hypothetical protein